MSADGSITLTWGDGDYRFRLAIGQLRELQQSVNKARIEIGEKPIGPHRLLVALSTRDWWIDDVRETLRLGLIGGGMKREEALAVVRRNFDGRPPLESVTAAQAVLLAALAGVEDDPVGKTPAGEAASEGTGPLPSPGSTETAQPSDGRPDRSMN